MSVAETVREAAESYVESERERWQETKELGPVGTLKRGFRQGLTGPAPTLDTDGSVDFGADPFRSINRLGFSAAGTDPDDAANDDRSAALAGIGGVILLAAVAVALGQLFTVNVSA